MIKQLSEIERLLAKLSQQATQYDLKSKIPSLAHRPIFDQQLFKNQSPRLYDYVTESYRLLEDIRALLKHKSPVSLLQFQCSKLVDQCQAIGKALASQQQRNASYQQEKNTRKTVAIRRQQQTGSFAWIAGNIMSNSVELYQELSKHHGYQQKLELKINQLDQQLSHCPINKKLPLQKDILKQHKRLGECRKAIYFIERKIEMLENGKLRKKF